MNLVSLKLSNDNIKLAYKLYHKLKYIYPDDELLSVILEGLCKASDTFDSTKGVAFSTYAWNVMKRTVISYYRKTRRELLILDIVKGDMTEEDAYGKLFRESEESSNFENLSDKKILSLISVSNKLQQDILHLIISSDTSPKQIAEIVGCSSQYVNSVLRKFKEQVLAKLKEG